MELAEDGGTFVFMFTDVEGSAELWQEDHKGMQASMHQLDALVQSAVENHGGKVIADRGEGDSHFAVFARPSRAIFAALDLTASIDTADWALPRPLRARVGIHLGEADRRAEAYYGVAVSRTARLRSVAHGGQVVASAAIADAAAPQSPAWVHYTSLGLHRIRNWPGPTEVFQVTRAGSASEFPPLKTDDLNLHEMAAVAVLDVDDSAAEVRDADHGQIVKLQRTLATYLRSVFDGHNGRVLRILGDGCMAGFDTPDQALHFATEAMAGIRKAGFLARVGIHYGAVDQVEDQLTGSAVVRSSELCEHASPGTLLASSIVRDLSLQYVARLRPLGTITIASSKIPIETFTVVDDDNPCT